MAEERELQPTAAQLNADGAPVSAHAVQYASGGRANRADPPLEIIAHRDCINSQAKTQKVYFAKSTAHVQMWSYNDLKTDSENNLVMCRKGKHVYVKARVSIPKEQLSIPIQSKSISNLSAVAGDDGGNNTPLRGRLGSLVAGQ